MINYRSIFNPSYNYIGLIVITIIILIIIFLQKDLLTSIYKISKLCLISSLITLAIGLLLNFIIEFFIISSYKIFIEIITKNVISSLYLYSLIIIITSVILIIILKTTMKNSN